MRPSDIRGIAQLAALATEGVTGIVEGVHQSVWSTMGVPGGAEPGRTRGITDLRHGHLLDEDWQGHDRFDRKPDDRRVVPLPEVVIPGTLSCATSGTSG